MKISYTIDDRNFYTAVIMDKKQLDNLLQYKILSVVIYKDDILSNYALEKIPNLSTIRNLELYIELSNSNFPDLSKLLLLKKIEIPFFKGSVIPECICKLPRLTNLNINLDNVNCILEIYQKNFENIRVNDKIRKFKLLPKNNLLSAFLD